MSQDLNVGEIAHYKEENFRFKVEVVENKCNADREAYRLRILEVCIPDPFTKGTQKGDEFDCDQTREEDGYSKWKLMKI